MRYFSLAFGLLLAASAIPASLKAQEKQKPTVTGAWTFNTEKSDNPQQKMQQAMRGGGPPRGGGGGDMGGMGRSGRAGGRTGGSRGGAGAMGGSGGAEGAMESGRGGRGGPEMRAMGSLLRGPARLSIERTDSTVTLNRDDLPPLVIFTDGRQVDLGGADSESRFTEKAEWKGDKLVVQTVVGENLKLEETYEIKGGDSPYLEVDAKLDNKAMSRTIKLKRVYDAATGG
jgi:hypothetical protein